MINEPKLDLSYIAGFFDGEGCVNISKSGLRATITNTDINVLLLIQKCYSKGKIRSRKLKDGEKRKPCYMLEFWSGDASLFLQSIIELLIIKKEQAEIGLLYQTTFRKKKVGRGFFGPKRLPEENRILREFYENKLKYIKHGEEIN